jgi:hypothetical protein
VGEAIDTSAYTTRNLDPLTAKLYAAIQDLQTQFADRDGSENGVEEGRMQHAE